MRYVIAFLAVCGIIVSGLALQVHYSNAVEPCDINSHWDCGIVNHSRYSMIAHIPVAAIGIAGYVAIALLAFFRRRTITLTLAIVGLGFALYLSNIEAHVLEVWCLYCVGSQIIIALITLLSFTWIFLGRRRQSAV
ncbi:MAG TPA: vitamin K epoxide reductase family protein [Acidobacteriaceae bacterium]|nr:vitamin K epoxide reductase family protein [Acidobacteriaceae bacterium]